jgi:hypothetical protein
MAGDEVSIRYWQDGDHATVYAVTVTPGSRVSSTVQGQLPDRPGQAKGPAYVPSVQ